MLHSFNNNGTDGYNPYASVIFDTSGNLYSTTVYGGVGLGGAVFELTPKAGGGWTAKLLHSFNTTDGANPYASLTFDSAGNLYGTTHQGGTYYEGVVFELTPGAGGIWTEKVLHNFGSSGDGYYPFSGLVLDSAGNLYGTTPMGGLCVNCGTVFELTLTAGGSWTESVLYSFSGTDLPLGGLSFDASGNLYGTTEYGGAYGSGTVFELTPSAGGSWTETTLYDFKDNGTDGLNPYASVIFDTFGNLYSTTYEGGGAHSYGTVFELKASSGGNWTEKVLHSFNSSGGGTYPYAGLILDAAGNLYGTTYEGGAYGYGTVFEIKH